eukprot:scaffold1790_cov257-Pinguiococcus_pyrenoidosus.AAC.5
MRFRRECLPVRNISGFSVGLLLLRVHIKDLHRRHVLQGLVAALDGDAVDERDGHVSGPPGFLVGFPPLALLRCLVATERPWNELLLVFIVRPAPCSFVVAEAPSLARPLLARGGLHVIEERCRPFLHGKRIDFASFFAGRGHGRGTPRLVHLRLHILLPKLGQDPLYEGFVLVLEGRHDVLHDLGLWHARLPEHSSPLGQLFQIRRDLRLVPLVQHDRSGGAPLGHRCRRLGPRLRLGRPPLRRLLHEAVAVVSRMPGEPTDRADAIHLQQDGRQLTESLRDEIQAGALVVAEGGAVRTAAQGLVPRDLLFPGRAHHVDRVAHQPFELVVAHPAFLVPRPLERRLGRTWGWRNRHGAGEGRRQEPEAALLGVQCCPELVGAADQQVAPEAGGRPQRGRRHLEIHGRLVLQPRKHLVEAGLHIAPHGLDVVLRQSESQVRRVEFQAISHGREGVVAKRVCGQAEASGCGLHGIIVAFGGSWRPPRNFSNNSRVRARCWVQIFPQIRRQAPVPNGAKRLRCTFPSGSRGSVSQIFADLGYARVLGRAGRLAERRSWGHRSHFFGSHFRGVVLRVLRVSAARSRSGHVRKANHNVCHRRRGESSASGRWPARARLDCSWEIRERPLRANALCMCSMAAQ